MILALQVEVEMLERSIDDLMIIRDNVQIQLDSLASVLETKKGMLAFESTAYTPVETRPVKFMEIFVEASVDGGV